MFRSIFPYDQSLLAEYVPHSMSEVDKRLALAEEQFLLWRSKPILARSELMLKMSQLLIRDVERLAQLITFEMGKTLDEARAEVEKCALCCRYYAQHGEEMLQNVSLPSRKPAYLLFQPIGAVLGIMPWNFPFWQVFRYAVPTILAGNVTLLKHAPNVTGCALEIEKLFLEAGFPEGVLQVLLIDVPWVERVVAHPLVQGVTLTGSEKAGVSVASLAGKYIKKSVLELGGVDAFVVLEDADLAKAASEAVKSRMQNAGQSCIAAKRWIVVESVADAFAAQVEAQIRLLRQGNPMDKQTTLAPMARLDLADTIERQYKESVAQGAEVVLGLNRDGCNLAPMLLAGLPAGVPALTEETFGPLAVIVKAKEEVEAVNIVNQIPYGLGASVWTKDWERAQRLAGQLAVGMVFVNEMVKSQPEMPFGGIGRSGYGRELGVLGIREFVNAKTVVLGG